jgi:hypothetical protein|tara:strand:- start:4765 stop:6081 length:1317 start_codon:yes stop_codon:yes gene_type:complete
MYKYNMGGSVPRETNIQGQRHSLAYINPFEEDLLQKYRGDMPTVPGPGGVPSYYYGQGMQTTSKAFQEGSSGTGKSSTFASSKPQKQTSNNNNDKDERRAAAEAQAQAQAQINAKLASGTYTKNTDGSLVNAGAVAGSASTTGRVNTAAPTVDVNNPKKVSAVTGQAATGPTAKELRDAKDARLAQGRSGLESLANTLTPNDFMVYDATGKLVYEANHPTVLAGNAKAGDAVDPNETNSFGFKVGMGNTSSNDATPGMYDQGFGSGVKSDLDMKFAAGFGTPEQQRTNLLLAGYTSDQADAYFSEMETAMARDPYVPGSGKDERLANEANQLAAAADPCPKGYKLDPISQQCVMDDTIDVLNPGGQQVTDFVMPSVNPVIGQAANYTGAVAPTYTPNPLQPYAPGVAGNLLQASAPGLARTPAMRNGGSVGGIMGLPR